MRESDLNLFRTAEYLMNVRGEYSKAISNFKKINAYHKNEIILYNIALCYQNQHKFAKAIEGYKSAIHINPRLAPALNNISLCYQKKINLTKQNLFKRSCLYRTH